MSLIADGLLIATCLTTAVYCLVLSRRLRRLSDTGDGIGQQIVRLNTVLEETRVSVGEIRATAKAASDQLAREIAAAKREGGLLQRQIRRVRSAAAAPQDPRADAEPRPAHRRAKIGPRQEDPLAARTAPGEFADEDDPPAIEAGMGAAGGTDLEQGDEGTFVEGGDIAEAQDHWPFAESPSDADDEEPASEGDPWRSGAADADPDPAGDHGDGDEPRSSERAAAAGLLRVQRMAV